MNETLGAFLFCAMVIFFILWMLSSHERKYKLKFLNDKINRLERENYMIYDKCYYVNHKPQNKEKKKYNKSSFVTTLLKLAIIGVLGFIAYKLYRRYRNSDILQKKIIPQKGGIYERYI